MVQNSAGVIAYFGYWPQFCDARIQQFSFCLPGTIKLSLFYIDSDKNKQATIELMFSNVTNMEFNDLITQNIIDKLDIRESTKTEVSIEAACGLYGSFLCAKAEVIHVTLMNKNTTLERVDKIRTVREELKDYYLELPRRDGDIFERKRYGKINYSFAGGEDCHLDLYEGDKESFNDLADFFVYIAELTSFLCYCEGVSIATHWPVDGKDRFLNPTPAVFFLEHMFNTVDCSRLIREIDVFEHEFFYEVPDFYRTLISGDNIKSIWTDDDINEFEPGSFLIETDKNFLYYEISY